MHYILERNASRRLGCALLTTLALACGSDPEANDMSSSTAGTTAASAGAKASAGKSGSTAMPTAGKIASTAAAGHASGTAGVASNDEDAGMGPIAGGGAGGHGAAGHAGTAAAAGSGGTTDATFTQVYAVFKTSCAGGNTCHVNGTRPGARLSLADQATAYKNLVDMASIACTGEQRVVAGDPDKSELVHTLEQTPIGNCTNTPKMPDNKPKLAQADIDLVKSWVKAGARDD